MQVLIDEIEKFFLGTLQQRVTHYEPSCIVGLLGHFSIDVTNFLTRLKTAIFEKYNLLIWKF